MENNRIRVGSIVKVVGGAALGNEAGTITKVLSKPGTLSDELARSINKRHSPKMNRYVMCEAISHVHDCHYMNKHSLWEIVLDLIPATEIEKDEYRKFKNRKHG